jgi:predicted nuclease of predicted toxin-antitoxin system
MRVLIDNALSPLVAEQLCAAGHDASHVRNYEMQAAPDADVLALAEREQRVIVSADTDFGALLALREKARPSFVLLRRTAGSRPHEQAVLLLDVLSRFESELSAGSVLTVTDDRVRIRSLPIRR